MKKSVAWVTPFDAKSAIGGHANIICQALSEKYDITIWSASFTENHNTSCKIIYFDKNIDVNKLKKYDYVIYDFGNNLLYHGAIFDLFTRYPGIVIIHDQVITGLVEQYCQEEYGRGSQIALESFLAYTEIYYGVKIKDLFKYAIVNGKSIFTPEMLKYGLLEHIIEKAKGIFVHAKFFNEQIRTKFLGPVGFSYLSCEREMQTKGDFEVINNLLSSEPSKVRIVSTGYVGEAKRIDKIVDVLLDNKELADRVQYVVVGAIETPYGAKLKTIAEKQLNGCLFMLDFQPTEVMESAIRTADLCVNLRYPNTEVCSLSLFEQMAFGKPVLVINSGIYGEVADDCVVKINIDTEREDIKNAIQTLINDRERFALIGENGRNFVKNECTIHGYAQRFHDFLQECDNFQQGDWDKTLYNRVIDTLFHEYLRTLCLNWKSTDDIVSQLTNRINSIFPSKTYTHNNRTIGLWLIRDEDADQFDENALNTAIKYVLSKLENDFDYCEVLTNSIDSEYVIKLFYEVTGKNCLAKKITFVDETNYSKIFKTAVLFESVTEDVINTLVMYSKSDCLITVDVSCYSVIKMNKPFNVIISDKLQKKISNINVYNNHTEISDIIWKLKSLEREGAMFIDGSNMFDYKKLSCFIHELMSKESNKLS